MSLINNALSGSLAAQIALEITSQNVANAATPGYTRQGALLVAQPAAQRGIGLGSAGNGVGVPALIRFSDGYKSQQMWRANSDLGEHDTAQPYLTQLEQVFSDDTSSVSTGLDAFFASLNAASVDPTSAPLRQQVITSASSLATRFASLDQVMTNQSAAIHQQRTSTVEQVNADATDIAALNRQIVTAQARNVNASSLIDTRDQKIDALANLIGVQVTDQPDGSRSVSLRGGPPLVAGSTAAQMQVTGHADGSQSLSLTFGKETFALPAGGIGGQLGGLQSFEDQTLVPMRQSIADMAGQLSTAVNGRLTAGYGTDGTAGTPLFIYTPNGSGSGLLAVNPALTAAHLGFSSDPALPGNSDNLLALVGLANQPMTIGALGAVPLGDANSQLLGLIATASQQNQSLLATAQTVRDQVQADWKSTSGVNTDEEAVNLLTYQQMVQANMKVIAVAGTLFDATLAMMG